MSGKGYPLGPLDDFVQQVAPTDSSRQPEALSGAVEIFATWLSKLNSRSSRRCMTSPAGASRLWNDARLTTWANGPLFGFQQRNGGPVLADFVEKLPDVAASVYY